MSNTYIAKNAYAFIRDLLKIYKPYFEAHFAKISQNLGGESMALLKVDFGSRGYFRNTRLLPESLL